MPKTILFPVTNRVHLPRQKLLIEELERVGIQVLTPHYPVGSGDMAERALQVMAAAEQTIKGGDLVLIRGDRFEMLPFAMVAAYRGIQVAHIEAGDLSGAIDNKVRHAISELCDYWFPTNEMAYARLARMDVPQERMWNFGSLDVEVAARHKPEKVLTEPYIVFAFHPVDNELEEDVRMWIQGPAEGRRIVHIRSNGDYARPQVMGEEFKGDKYLDLIAGADLLVGNSSSFLKEASVYKTPVVNVGNRQRRRLMPAHVLSVPYAAEQVAHGMMAQLQRVRHEIESPYYQEGTAAKIAGKIKEILS